ncbi:MULTISPECIES: glycosyltransferase [Enterobacter]|jgi:glycosyltransferase involved in cell wall biosynthesis|uniref:Glycosyltransferase n=2 Tax=Enterobacter TaxID=547 RepID=A0ABX4VJE8_9ENTR|nr:MULTISPECIES: glycosyltransferase [Enterobacter]MBZ6368668.1 glycosyltransferase [Enterobacter bugandensis]MCK6762346.1 glycosyltransferase [Enterobacter bugandensis]MCK6833467.1 glycosyltransferase [Enterobacter bugandensis]MCK7332272.1 glycosyltransferase [Enterobacter bugandensis]MCK7391013.1 glycosyltransferase [Enterobacter bugandensis]
MPHKSKILLLDTGKEWGGGTNSMLELLKRINRDKFDITCCFYSDYSRAEGETIGQVLNSIGIPLIVIPQRQQPLWAKLLKEAGRSLLFFSRGARKTLTRYVDILWRIRPNVSKIETLFMEGGFDTLYMNNQPGSNEEGYLAAAKLQARLIQHCRIEPVLTPPLVKLVNAHATKIIAVSHGVERVLLQHGVRPELCTTVNNAIDIHQPLPDRRAMRQRLGIDADTFVFGSIGSLIPRKANHHTLEALAKFSQKHPQAKWKMVLVGEGAERRALAEQARTLGIEHHVIFTGFQNTPFDYLATFDAFILASKSEGLPRVVLEAMLLNIPVIGSAVTGTAELIDHDSTGLLFPWSDVSQLAQHLDSIWTDAALRARLAAAAYQNVCQNYAIENYVSGVEAVLGAH